MLLLIGEAKYKFVFGGERRNFWMQNSKTSYRNEYSGQTTVPWTMLLTSETPSVVNKSQD